MKREKNELLQFLAGLLMLGAGLFIFMQKVTVSSGLFGFGFSLGGLHVSNGLIIVPFIIGIVWMFASDGSFAAKIVTAAGVLIIILAVIMTTNIYLQRITLYEWILILVLIFGGAGLLAKILFGGKRSGRTPHADTPEIEQTSGRISDRAQSVEDELERLKKDR